MGGGLGGGHRRHEYISSPLRPSRSAARLIEASVRLFQLSCFLSLPPPPHLLPFRAEQPNVFSLSQTAPPPPPDAHTRTHTHAASLALARCYICRTAPTTSPRCRRSANKKKNKKNKRRNNSTQRQTRLSLRDTPALPPLPSGSGAGSAGFGLASAPKRRDDVLPAFLHLFSWQRWQQSDR